MIVYPIIIIIIFPIADYYYSYYLQVVVEPISQEALEIAMKMQNRPSTQAPDTVLISPPNQPFPALPSTSNQPVMLLSDLGRQQVKLGYRRCSNLDVPYIGDPKKKVSNQYPIILSSFYFYFYS